ncbi:MAG TPA: hypothetical protein VH416_05405 [Gaiellaceae bacterium]
MPVRPAAVVSCHLERPLDDRAWGRFERLARARPGGLAVVALIRPPHEGESRERWLERARRTAELGPLGHHTHWTSPTHARPTGGDPAARVLEEGAWLREQGLEPTLFCGGGWYMDEAVAEAVAALGYADCTVRGRAPCTIRLPDGTLLPALPTTHSLGTLARGSFGRLPPYVHAYFHDYDLLDARRRLALATGLRLLGLSKRETAEPGGPEVPFSEAFSQ